MLQGSLDTPLREASYHAIRTLKQLWEIVPQGEKLRPLIDSHVRAPSRKWLLQPQSSLQIMMQSLLIS